MIQSPLLTRLTARGPKRILALDGGGIRGVITLAFLARMQTVLRERHGDPSLVLADYFDLIGGTSTGAIIAAALALGMDVDDVLRMYMNVGGKVFSRRNFIPMTAWFDAAPLEEVLRGTFGERRLDDPDIRTGLCIVTKRADTRSTWPLLNHPQGKFFEQNRAIPLRSAVRASAAAPGFFTPAQIDVGNGEQALFVDGGVSTAANPALLLFLIATLKGFPFRWETGEDKLLVVSVGTGTWREPTAPETIANYKLWNWATEVPAMLIHDSSVMGEVMLQALSRSVTARAVDAEIGDQRDDLIGAQPALSYLRYNVVLEQQPLKELGVELPLETVRQMRRMQAGENRQALWELGVVAADRILDPAHCCPFPLARA